MTKIGQIPFSMIGGHPALDLVNTRPMSPDGLCEKLVDFFQLAQWVRQANLISAATARKLSHTEADSVVREVRVLREALRETLEAKQSGRPNWRVLTARINANLKRHPGVEDLKPTKSGDFTLMFKKSVSEPNDLTWIIAREIAAFLASGDWRRARACDGSGCVLWFVDRTRNQSRHWCRMETCGSRAKAKAYYRRKMTR